MEKRVIDPKTRKCVYNSVNKSLRSAHFIRDVKIYLVDCFRFSFSGHDARVALFLVFFCQVLVPRSSELTLMGKISLGLKILAILGRVVEKCDTGVCIVSPPLVLGFSGSVVVNYK